MNSHNELKVRKKNKVEDYRQRALQPFIHQQDELMDNERLCRVTRLN